MKTLILKKCCSCSMPFKGKEIKTHMEELEKNWKVKRGHHIEKEYTFNDFAQALAFTNKVGALAEREYHHPDILLSWGKVKVTFWTHSVNGLSEKDFSLAKMCDEIK